MPVFVQQSNGNIRRIRGTFGGSCAYKQHDDGGFDDSGRCRRSRLLQQIECDLAHDQLVEVFASGRFNHISRNGCGGSQHHKCARQQPPANSTQSVPSVPSMQVLPKAPPRPHFKVVISASGKIVAVPTGKEAPIA